MTDIDPAALLAEANRHAQFRFHEMLEAKAYSDPNDPLTVRYIEAERVVDDILGEVQWEASKAGMDELQASDTRPCPACAEPVADGDTHWSLFQGIAGGWACPKYAALHAAGGVD